MRWSGSTAFISRAFLESSLFRNIELGNIATLSVCHTLSLSLLSLSLLSLCLIERDSWELPDSPCQNFDSMRGVQVGLQVSYRTTRNMSLASISVPRSGVDAAVRVNCPPRSSCSTPCSARSSSSSSSFFFLYFFFLFFVTDARTEEISLSHTRLKEHKADRPPRARERERERETR